MQRIPRAARGPERRQRDWPERTGVGEKVMIIERRGDETRDRSEDRTAAAGPIAPSPPDLGDASTVKDSAVNDARTESGLARDGQGPATEPIDSPVCAGETAAVRLAETEIGDNRSHVAPDSSNAGRPTLPAEADDSSALGAASSLPARFIPGDRFRPVRHHASGGIGLVWVAQDRELQREVALKVIQPRFSRREDQRARFLLEAEITGKLEHPGIVPVYSLGSDAEGRPYYAMRLIRGESFAAAIRQFHQGRRAAAGAASKSGPADWGVEFRQLLGSFLDVCHTIDYAHSRCVLHRDLKPANIMLGPYGETLVVDWGLAKVIGEPDVLPPQSGGGFDLSLAHTMTSLAGETAPGTAMGTPAYMSPEQAGGQVDKVGPASDVYSLGATLYELLTGQTAFTGENMKDVIAKVKKGEFPPPRAVERSLPAPLEAICLKAMATKPVDRFPSAGALARDIERWLADEPVSAYPERAPERLALAPPAPHLDHFGPRRLGRCLHGRHDCAGRRRRRPAQRIGSAP